MHKPILVVEDDIDIRAALSDVLSVLGYAVRSVANGQEALDYLMSVPQTPNLILLDLMMPVMDGWQFCAEQAKNPKISHIPVVIVTADGNAREKANKLGVKEGIKKPIEFEDLMRIAQKYA